jgi:hypothetical protein
MTPGGHLRALRARRRAERGDRGTAQGPHRGRVRQHQLQHSSVGAALRDQGILYAPDYVSTPAA